MALLTTQRVAPEGTAPAFSAADAAGDQFVNDDRAYLHVKNGDTTATTVTVNSVQPCSQGFDHDITVSVPAGGERMIGPFAGGRFNDPANNRVSVTYSKVTALTVAAITTR